MQDILTKKRLIISVVIFIAIVLALTVKFVIDNMIFQDHGRIRLLNIPSRITMEIDGKKYKFSDSDTLRPIVPGTYDILFYSEGFDSKKVENITITKDAETSVFVELTPLTDEAKKDLEENYEKYDLIRQVGFGEDFKTEKEKIDEEFPIFSKLPFYGRGYNIMSCEAYRQETIKNNGLGLCVNIDEPDRGDIEIVNKAIEKAQELLADYNKPYDLKVNDSIYPTQAEINQKLVYDCSQERGLSFCYEYYYQDYEASER